MNTATHQSEIATMTPKPLVFLALATLIPACSQFPDLDDATGKSALNAPYPDLVPAETIHAAAATTTVTETTAPQFEARSASLKARAARLRGAVLNEEDKDRLDEEITIEGEDI